MKLLLTFLIGMLPVLFLHSQDSTFNLLYSFGNKNDLAYSSCEITGKDQYLVSIVSFGSGFDYAGILKISASGKILDTAYFGQPGYAYYPDNIIPTSDTNYILSGTKYKNGNGILYLYKINEGLDTLWSREYQYGIGNEGIHKIIKTQDKGVLILGYSQTFANNESQNFIIKTDSLGHKQWEIIYGDSTHLEEAYDAVELIDSTFLIIFRRTYQQNDNIVLLKVSPQGQVIWERELNTPRPTVATVVMKVSNHLLLLGGQSYISDIIKRPYVVCIDTSGNTIWEKTYSSTLSGTFFDGSRIDSNAFVFAGSIDPDQNTERVGYVAKINASGSLQWSTMVTPDGKPNDNSQEYFYGVNALSDGGVLCTGFTFKGPVSGTQDAWILKLDSLGQCDTALCFPWLVGFEPLKGLAQGHIQVYPNPLTDNGMLEIRNMNSQIKGEDIYLDFLSPDGRMVQRIRGYAGMGSPSGMVQLPITCGRLASGIYLIKAWNGKDRIYGTVKVMVE